MSDSTKYADPSEVAPAGDLLAAGEGEIVDVVATITPEVVAEIERRLEDQSTATAKDVPLPFPRPSFDLEAAMKQIEAKERSATYAWSEHDRVHKQGLELKKKAETEDLELHALIRDLRERREEAQSTAGMAAAVQEIGNQENPEAAKPGCLYERQTGKPCPICRNPETGTERLKQEGLTRSVDDYCDPMHPDHEVAARDMADCEALSAELREINCCVDAETLGSAVPDSEDRDRLGAWASSVKAHRENDGGIVLTRPEWFTPCEAAEPGTDGQGCRVCGGPVWVLSAEGGAPYPVGALVGVECQGAPVEEARPVKKRGSKKGRKPHDPEKIAAEQRQVGYPEACERGLAGVDLKAWSEVRGPVVAGDPEAKA